MYHDLRSSHSGYCDYEGPIVGALVYIFIEGQYPLDSSHYMMRAVSHALAVDSHLYLQGNDAEPVTSSEGGIAALL